MTNQIGQLISKDETNGTVVLDTGTYNLADAPKKFMNSLSPGEVEYNIVNELISYVRNTTTTGTTTGTTTTDTTLDQTTANMKMSTVKAQITTETNRATAWQVAVTIMSNEVTLKKLDKDTNLTKYTTELANVIQNDITR